MESTSLKAPGVVETTEDADMLAESNVEEGVNKGIEGRGRIVSSQCGLEVLLWVVEYRSGGCEEELLLLGGRRSGGRWAEGFI